MYIRDFAMQFNWYFIGSCNKRSAQPSLSCQRGTTPNTRKEMVHWTVDDYIFWRAFAVRLYIYWSVRCIHFGCFIRIQKNQLNFVQVLCIHIVLGLQDLLCVRLYDAGVSNIDCSHGVCDNSDHLFPPQCWRLQMVRLKNFIFPNWVSLYWN